MPRVARSAKCNTSYSMQCQMHCHVCDAVRNALTGWLFRLWDRHKDRLTFHISSRHAGTHLMGLSEEWSLLCACRDCWLGTPLP